MSYHCNYSIINPTVWGVVRKTQCWQTEDAKSIHCEYIITRIKKDFEKLNIPLLSLIELFR